MCSVFTIEPIIVWNSTNYTSKGASNRSREFSETKQFQMQFHEDEEPSDFMKVRTIDSYLL